MPNNPIEKFEHGINVELTEHLIGWLEERFPNYRKLENGFGITVYLSAIAALIIFTHRRGLHLYQHGTPQTKISEYIGVNRKTLRRFITKLKLQQYLTTNIPYNGPRRAPRD